MVGMGSSGRNKAGPGCRCLGAPSLLAHSALGNYARRGSYRRYFKYPPLLHHLLSTYIYDFPPTSFLRIRSRSVSSVFITQRSHSPFCRVRPRNTFASHDNLPPQFNHTHSPIFRETHDHSFDKQSRSSSVLLLALTFILDLLTFTSIISPLPSLSAFAEPCSASMYFLCVIRVPSVSSSSPPG
jgi:hypothetical protein